jgi:SAM-dependent methyltransferase
MIRSLISSTSLDALGDWYHAWSTLGVSVRQREGNFAINQRCKQGLILGYLQLALEKCKQQIDDAPSVLELFCADGYYAAHARRMGAGRVQGIDLDAPAVGQANAMFSTLYGEQDVFKVADVHTYEPPAPADVVLCTGGLYHVAAPWRVLERCRDVYGSRYLVVQTVVTLEGERPDYFVTPAPGWQHGSRFTMAFLIAMIRETGWTVLDSHANELEANELLCERGSAYVFCERSR